MRLKENLVNVYFARMLIVMYSNSLRPTKLGILYVVSFNVTQLSNCLLLTVLHTLAHCSMGKQSNPLNMRSH